jgi:hypothetical protein
MATFRVLNAEGQKQLSAWVRLARKDSSISDDWTLWELDVDEEDGHVEMREWQTASGNPESRFLGDECFDLVEED